VKLHELIDATEISMLISDCGGVQLMSLAQGFCGLDTIPVGLKVVTMLGEGALTNL